MTHFNQIQAKKYHKHYGTDNKYYDFLLKFLLIGF